ncbi:hypothetical protein [Gluconacetobacter diazotrophicus]|uniref:hypothetical protein n=1 Tax=Gluconacetobacter diazotrophicus TaxID=33996 RepID=UPI00119ADB67|nr:hypothetical protein [Gluconacetobacter diazotrophicus]TWA98107.1 hypothetical protein FBZ86_1593 [Gluconacetobacter diazotrophicus]
MNSNGDDTPHFKVQLITLGNHNPFEIYKYSFLNFQTLLKSVEEGQSENPEADIRSALDDLLKVFWFDIASRTQIARVMHTLGKFLLENYGCALGFKDGCYFTSCPNLLLHHDYGFSLRALEKYKCSICNEDPIDCDHRTGRMYRNITCHEFDNRCNICCSDIDKCGHILGNTYDDIEAIKIVIVVDLITFDLVKEPEFVFSRVLEITYPKEYILNSINNDPDIEEFSYGESKIFCDHCLSCNGYDPQRTSALFEAK